MLKYFNSKSLPQTYFLVCIAFIALLTSWQCFEVPPDPVLPTWDTQLSIPLIDTIFYLNDALKKNPDILLSGENYHYRPQPFKFDSIGIGDKLVLHPESSFTLEQQIGTMKINLAQPVSISIDSRTMFGVTQSQNAPVPPFSWNGSLQAPLINEFQYAHLSAGEMKLEIRNSLSFTVGLPQGIRIYNRSTQETIASFPSTTIDPHSTFSPSNVSLSGTFIRNDLGIEFTVESQGTNNVSVSVHPDSGIIVSSQIINGEEDEIRGQTFERLDYSTVFSPYLVDDSSYFQHVSLKKGGFRLEVENTLEVGIDARISMEEFVDTTTNQPFNLNLTLSKQSTFTQNYDLSKWKIEALNGLSQTATCSLSVTSPTLNASTPITVRAGDKVKLRLISIDTPYVVRRIAGVSRPIWFNINDTVDLDVGKFSSNFSADSVVLDSITMAVNLFSAVGHPIDFDFTLEGISSSGSIINSMKVQPGGSPNPNMRRLNPSTNERLTFSNLGRFVSDFLTKRGKQIIIRGSALVNPPDVYASRQVGSVEDTTRFYSSLDVTALMKIGIFNGAFADTLDLDDNGEDKIDKDVLTKIKQASVFFNIENAMPMGVSLHTSFLNVNNSPILSLPKFNETPIAIQAGTPDVPRQTPSPIRVSVQTSDADKFNDTKRVIVRIVLNSNNIPTAFTNRDYIRVRAYANIVANINTK